VGRYVALFRGVNVGGRARVSMQDLRELFGSLGHSDLATYVQSGNVVFRSKKSDTSQMRRAIEDKVREDLGLDVTVLLRSAAELRGVLGSNPLVGLTDDDRLLHVTFLASEPDPLKVPNLDEVQAGDDLLSVSGSEVYLYCPGGYSETKLNNTFIEKRLGVPATTRNWRTVNKLAEMVA
jgi:uncharacterized protein (DUF1697 family)